MIVFMDEKIIIIKYEKIHVQSWKMTGMKL